VSELRLDNSIVDDRYLVDRCLGRGSYAEVFLAYDQQSDDEPVIIKALNTSLQGTPDADLERTLIENFQNEAIALDRVRHPNIIRRLGHGTASDLNNVPFHYLVLEYMPGGDLLRLCTKRPLDLDRAMFYFQQIAEALAFAHSRQVIHRDIKPNNLLLSADTRVVKIADFGVAKMIYDDSSEITRVGTNVYAPPEHHPDAVDSDVGERLTASADVYSLAKTVYTAMTGRAPRQYSRLPIAELPVELSSQPWSASLINVLRKATAARASDRYHSIQEFWTEFARLKLGETEQAPLAEDDEVTIVRSRLTATSTAGPAASQPHFQTLAASTSATARMMDHPRIMVDLPSKAGAHSTAPATTQPNVIEIARKPDAVETKTLGSEQIDSTESDAGKTHRSRPRFRLRLRTEWLRWAFTGFLLVALIGIVASTYYHFAENPNGGFFAGLRAKEGTIAGATNVNLRSEPAGGILVVLPAGTRVRIIEERGSWMRVKVVQWAAPAPEGAVETGWVGSQFVKSD